MNNSKHHSFNYFFQNSLNPEQQQVVAPKDGVLLVCAGAGSGKTRVITARMANLIVNHNIPPNQILALTFTNKAAKEMKERITNFLGEDTRLPYVDTFHSYCLRLLKSNIHLLPIGVFSLLDDDDQEKLIKGIISRSNLHKKITAKQIISFISRIKNEAVTQKERDELLNYDPLLSEFYHKYEQAKFIAHCLDFDDLLITALQLFEKFPNFKENFQNQVRHVLVDEYQDTNKVQHALLKAMTQNDNKEFCLDSLCVVGDEDQSIYSWRGATVSNIINFNKDFANTYAITIEQNYRSVQPILKVANEIIQNNAYRNPKKLWSDREAFDRIRILACSSGYQEGEALAQFAKQLRANYSQQSHAILYRSHFQSRALEEALIRHSIPYKIIGGIQFYDRLEIKDMLAYLRLIINPFDRFAFSRAINTPSRGLGDKFEELFFSIWNEHPFATFFEVANALIDKQLITKSKADSLKTFISVFENLSPQSKASHALSTILHKTAYYGYLRDSFEQEDADAKKDNIKELLNGILFFEENTKQNLERFLEEVSLLQEHMAANESVTDFVKLMTLHAAKGLEFDTVMLSGIEEGILPSAHSLYAPENLEEERRLLYVGITRAKERLLISYTRYRYTYGNMTDQRPSRFIDEIPEQYLHVQDCSYWNPQEISKYFYNWLHRPAGHALDPKKEEFQNEQALPGDIEYEKFASKSSQNTLIRTDKQKYQYKIRHEISSGEESQEYHNSEWSIDQSIMHETFGRGVIQKFEKNYAVVRFKAGIKKIDPKFLKTI